MCNIGEETTTLSEQNVNVYERYQFCQGVLYEVFLDCA